MDPGKANSRHDALALVVLLAGLALYCIRAVNFGGRPEEDAAMLLRYSGHLAAGHGIVWNLGEAPVDGATDFLFMLAVALLHRLGLSLETAAQGLGLVAHAATVLVAYLCARRSLGAPAALAFVPAAFLALGPGLRHLAAGYGTPLFALLAALAWWAAIGAARAREDLAAVSLLLAFASLFLGLARPEGVFLGAFFLLAVIAYRGGDGARLLVTRFALVFLTLGLAYFLWRFWYFGHPLPNPFYRKGGGILHPHSLRVAWRDLWNLSAPFLAVLVAGLLPRATRRLAVFHLLPAAAFVSLWVLISDETNYVMRFRYPILFVVLMGFASVATALLRRANDSSEVAWPSSEAMRRRLGWAAALAVAAGLGTWQHSRYHHIAPQRMGLYDAALVLRDYRSRNYTVATTEAGLLPLYSTWRAVDAWGLNDPWIAHHGSVTEEYLDRYRPEVIVFHAYFSPETPQEGRRIEERSLGPAWYRMVATLRDYAERNEYVLAAVFGRNAWDTHYYYVRSGFRDTQVLVTRLHSLDYFWDGEPTANFAPAPEPARAPSTEPEGAGNGPRVP